MRRLLRQIYLRLKNTPGVAWYVSVALIVFALLAVTGGVILLVVLALTSHAHDYSDRLVAVGDVLAGGTLALALIAGVVALLAYIAATGFPDLKVQAEFAPWDRRFSEGFVRQINQPCFSPLIVEHSSPDDLMCNISLHNLSSYSAKSPAVIVRLHAMHTIMWNNESWVAVDFDPYMRVTAIQWDGGPASSVHGHSVRVLPPLRLALFYLPEHGEPSVDVELLAEGYRRIINLHVTLSEITDDEAGLIPRMGGMIPLLTVESGPDSSARPPEWI